MRQLKSFAPREYESFLRAMGMRLIFAAASLRDASQRDRAKLLLKGDANEEWLPHKVWVDWQEARRWFEQVHNGLHLDAHELDNAERCVRRILDALGG